MKQTIYIDNSRLNSMVSGDLLVCGEVRIYLSSGREVSQVGCHYFDPDKGYYSSPEEKVEETIEGLGIEDFYEHAYGDLENPLIPEFGAEFTCLEPYWQVDVEDKKVVNIKLLEKDKQACQCKCGFKVHHNISPIPKLTKKEK